ncbi:MAG: hypothetical protein HYS05_15350 [Acidobacteria bacterium]|nr:hypothetical protein [Acidobacteriota bacterium]
MQASDVPQALRHTLGDAATLELLELFDTAREENRNDVLTAATDRFERRLTEECGKIRLEIAGLRHDMTQGFGTLRVELLKWSFLFWIGQVAAITAIMTAILRGFRL